MKGSLRVLPVAMALVLPLLYSSCGDGGGTGPEQEPAETLASFELVVPDSVAEGEAFPLTVRAVGNRGSSPLTSYSGSVTLSTTLGTVNPSSLSVSNGTGSAQVTLSNPGQQTLSASGGGQTGSVGVDVTDLPEPPIEGDPQATLEEAVRDSLFKPRAEDYSTDHPDLGGLYVSHNTLLMAFEVGTTVGEANALLAPLGAEFVGGIQGVPDQAASILVVRLPTTSHQEMETALATLRANALVLAAAQDALLGPDALPPSGGSHPVGWKWAAPDAGDNHHLKAVRVPEMWNFNRALEKQGQGTMIGIVDLGFYHHEDLIFEDFGIPIDHYHGTVIAGTIGAIFDNDLGIEGIYPFIRETKPMGGMVTLAIPMELIPPGGTTLDKLTSAGQLMSEGIKFLIDQRPGLQVINMSLGYDWAENGINPASGAAMNLANSQGILLTQELQGTASPPLIVVSAGNDNGADARYNSPMTNAALVQNVFNILVVEAVYWDGTKFTRYQTSNVGGHLSAPGFYIFSTNVGPDGYGSQTGNVGHVGTSFAAGMVSGLAAYLLAADKDLNPAQVKQILMDNAVPAGGGARPMIDAWASVMGIDELRGDNRILRRMLDIDDGTEDGDQFVNFEEDPSSPEFTNEELDADGDEGIGDDDIDMSDFRRWRDWYLHIWDYGSVDHIDPDHKKRDVNDNGVTEDDAGESLYPRGDFNGDGLLSTEPEDTAFVGGAIQANVSDLDVLKVLFDDPNYLPSDLDTLVYSQDVHFNLQSLWENTEAPPEQTEARSVKIEVRDGDTNALVQSRIVSEDDEEDPVFTLAAAEDTHRPYRIEVSTTDTDFTFGDHKFYMEPRGGGWDYYLRPVISKKVDVRGTFLRVCDNDQANVPVILNLDSLGLKPGDRILGYAVGDAALAGAGPEEEASVYAVFSGSDVLLDDTLRYRVPDAIGTNITTESNVMSCFQGKAIPTEIPQDFRIPNEGAVFDVPEGATYLFLARFGTWYLDNFDVDGDYGLHLVIIRRDFEPGWWGWGQVSEPEMQTREGGVPGLW